MRIKYEQIIQRQITIIYILTSGLNTFVPVDKSLFVRPLSILSGNTISKLSSISSSNDSLCHAEGNKKNKHFVCRQFWRLCSVMASDAEMENKIPSEAGCDTVPVHHAAMTRHNEKTSNQ